MASGIAHPVAALLVLLGPLGILGKVHAESTGAAPRGLADDEVDCSAAAHHPNETTGNDDCCSLWNRCEIGEGDCDSDGECEGALVCGKDNCPWGDGDDCCQEVTCSANASDTTTGNDDCCTENHTCSVGEGDCDSDSDCEGALVCGTDNCPWGDGDDCCQSANCSAGAPDLTIGNDFCCSESRPCDIGEGDCDLNSDCKEGLVCGKDNCGWGDEDDCCEEAHCTANVSDTTVGNDNCCTPSNPCGIDEGDCDTDEDCSGTLVCGTDNCVWGDEDDCCQTFNLEQCKNQCLLDGFCCGRDSGCGRPSCQLGCEIATSAASRAECKKTCDSATGCSFTPEGFWSATMCQVCNSPPWGGQCTTYCETKGGCAHACEMMAEAN